MEKSIKIEKDIWNDLRLVFDLDCFLTATKACLLLHFTRTVLPWF